MVLSPEFIPQIARVADVLGRGVFMALAIDFGRSLGKLPTYDPPIPR
jgi:hypothetical protein